MKDSYPTVCGECMGFIDRLAVVAALKAGRAYVHECGRVLVKEKP